MLDFNKYLMRHGESAVQAIIEQLERYEGIRASVGSSLDLEERWQNLMASLPSQSLMSV